jgi:FKBP-type peptidyl-prolyl cis-trans isomerase
MKKTTWIFAASVLGIAFISCNKGNSAFKHVKGGMEYKIISSGKGAPAAYGEVMKFHFIQKYKDSTIKQTYDQLPVYQPIDSMQLPKEYFDIFKQVRPGDSIITRILTDSVFKGGLGMMPKEFKKGEYMFTNFKVLSILKLDKMQEDRMAEMKKVMEADSIHAIGQKIKDDKELQDYFAGHNIKPVKTELGTYVDIQEKGGETVKEGQTMSVKYTGKLLDGTPFDSNVDSSFRHPEPYNVTIGRGGSIEGFEDGLKQFGKGGKGVIYIPSVLGYGTHGSGKIKPNSNLIFEVEILDVKDPAQPVMPPATDTAKKRLLKQLPLKKKN